MGHKPVLAPPANHSIVAHVAVCSSCRNRDVYNSISAKTRRTSQLIQTPLRPIARVRANPRCRRVRGTEPGAPPSVRARHPHRHLPGSAAVRGTGRRPSELLQVPARRPSKYVLGGGSRRAEGVCRSLPRLERHRGGVASLRSPARLDEGRDRACAFLRSQGSPRTSCLDCGRCDPRSEPESGEVRFLYEIGDVDG